MHEERLTFTYRCVQDPEAGVYMVDCLDWPDFYIEARSWNECKLLAAAYTEMLLDSYHHDGEPLPKPEPKANTAPSEFQLSFNTHTRLLDDET